MARSVEEWTKIILDDADGSDIPAINKLLHDLDVPATADNKVAVLHFMTAVRMSWIAKVG